MQNNITPIFIIGTARNGTTNLENMISTLPNVLRVQHWLHYGSKQSNIYMNNKYWGDLSGIDEYLNFVYQYASSDYFHICNGDIEFHLEHKRDNFYDFFLDLMDHNAKKEAKKYWVTKLDPHFFMDKEERKKFFSLVQKRYQEIKFIRIKRDFKDAFKSYLNMEGKSYNSRQKSLNIFPALLLQASRYTLTYQNDFKQVGFKILDISFQNYIANRRDYLKKVSIFLEIKTDAITSLNLSEFQVNTSFKNKKKNKLPHFIESSIPKTLVLFSKYPFIARFVWRFYYTCKRKSAPISRRLLKHKYHKMHLVTVLEKTNSQGLIQKIREEANAGDS